MSDPRVITITIDNVISNGNGNVDWVKVLLSDPRVDLDCGKAAESNPELAKLVEEEKLRRKNA